MSSNNNDSSGEYNGGGYGGILVLLTLLIFAGIGVHVIWSWAEEHHAHQADIEQRLKSLEAQTAKEQQK